MAHQPERFLKALSDGTRRKIVELLSKEGEMSVSDIAARLKITQPTASHHLQILRIADMVTPKREGKSIYYQFNRNSAKRIIMHLSVRFKIL